MRGKGDAVTKVPRLNAGIRCTFKTVITRNMGGGGTVIGVLWLPIETICAFHQNNLSFVVADEWGGFSDKGKLRGYKFEAEK